MVKSEMKLELILLGYLIFQSLDIWVIFQQKEYHNIQLSALLVHDACIMHIPSPQPPWYNSTITIHSDVSHVYDFFFSIQESKNELFYWKIFRFKRNTNAFFWLMIVIWTLFPIKWFRILMDSTWNFIFLYFIYHFKKQLLVIGERFGLRQCERIKNCVKEGSKTKAKKCGLRQIVFWFVINKILLLIIKRMKEEKTQNIFKHRTVSLLSFCFCYFSPRSLLIRHWTYFRQPAEDGIIAYLLVQFNPGEVASTVGILESKEPHLPESNGFDSLVE